MASSPCSSLAPRFVQLLDSVLWYLIPISEEGIGTFNMLRVSVSSLGWCWWDSLLCAGLGAGGLQHIPVVPAFPLELRWPALLVRGTEELSPATLGRGREKEGTQGRIRPRTSPAHPLLGHEAVPAAVQAQPSPHHPVPPALGDQPAFLPAEALHQPAAGPRAPRPPGAGPRRQEHRLHPGTVAPGWAFAASALLGLAASQSPFLLVLRCRCTKACKNTPRRPRSPWTTGGFSALPFGVSPPWSRMWAQRVSSAARGGLHGAVAFPQVAPELQPVVGV